MQAEGEGGQPFEYDAFISYSSRDRKKVEVLQHFLQTYPVQGARHMRVFLDKTDLATRGLWTELGAALQASRRLILMVSPHSMASMNVLKELALFHAQRPSQDIVVVLLAGEPSLIPDGLQGHKYADLRGALRWSWLRPRTRESMLGVLAAISDFKLRDLVPWDRQRRHAQYRQVGFVVALVALAVGLLFHQERRRRQQAYDDSLFAQARSQAFFADQVPLTIAYLQGSDTLLARADVNRILASLAGYIDNGMPPSEPAASSPMVLQIDDDVRVRFGGSAPLLAPPVRGHFTNAVWNGAHKLLALAEEDGAVSLVALDPLKLVRTVRLFQPDAEDSMRFTGPESLSIKCVNAIDRNLVSYFVRYGSAAGMANEIMRTVDFRTGGVGKARRASRVKDCGGEEVPVVDLGQVQASTPFDEREQADARLPDDFDLWQRADFYPSAGDSDQASALRDRWTRFVKESGVPVSVPGLDGDGIDKASKVEALSLPCDDHARYLHVTESLGRAYAHHLIRFIKASVGYRFDGVVSTESPGDFKFGFVSVGPCKVMAFPTMELFRLAPMAREGQLGKLGWIADVASRDNIVWARTERGAVFSIPLPDAGGLKLRPPVSVVTVPGGTTATSDDSAWRRGLFALGDGWLLATTTGSRVSLFDERGKIHWTSQPHERLMGLVGAVRRTAQSIVLATPDAWLEVDLATGFPLGGWQMRAPQDPGEEIESIQAAAAGGFVLSHRNGRMTAFMPKVVPDSDPPVKVPLAVPMHIQDGGIVRGWPAR